MDPGIPIDPMQFLKKTEINCIGSIFLVAKRSSKLMFLGAMHAMLVETNWAVGWEDGMKDL